MGILRYKILAMSQPAVLIRLTVKLCLATVVFVSLPVSAEEVSREYKIKAAFIYNFSKFIVWPQQNTSSDAKSFNVCTLGDDRLYEVAHTIEGKLVQGRMLHVKKIENAEDSATCNIIFFATSDTEKIQQSLDFVKGSTVLTIGDNSHFIDNGGVIALYTENNQIVFDINHIAAKENGLKVNSRLLELAKNVSR